MYVSKIHTHIPAKKSQRRWLASLQETYNKRPHQISWGLLYAKEQTTHKRIRFNKLRDKAHTDISG